MTTLDEYPIRSFEKLRYADTDCLGHINNAIFSTMLETGRMELLNPLVAENAILVIVHLNIDYKQEVKWPGTAEIGTRVVSVGNSSVKLYQEIFQDQQSVAVAETVIVQIHRQTRRSTALTPNAINTLTNLLGEVPA